MGIYKSVGKVSKSRYKNKCLIAKGIATEKLTQRKRLTKRKKKDLKIKKEQGRKKSTTLNCCFMAWEN